MYLGGRALGVTVAVAVISVTVVTVVWATVSDSDCQAKVQADGARIRTDRRWIDDDLPSIGEYVDARWQVRPAENPCSWTAGPTDWRYQGIIRLRPLDAAELATSFDDWQPVPPSPGDLKNDTPSQMWPALASLAPPGARWLHSAAYKRWVDTATYGPDDTADSQHAREATELYLDPQHAVVFFARSDRRKPVQESDGG